MVFKQIISQRDIPLKTRLPQAKMIDMDCLTTRELDRELEKGSQDVLAGRTKPAGKVFEEIRKYYHIR